MSFTETMVSATVLFIVLTGAVTLAVYRIRRWHDHMYISRYRANQDRVSPRFTVGSDAK